MRCYSIELFSLPWLIANLSVALVLEVVDLVGTRPTPSSPCVAAEVPCAMQTPPAPDGPVERSGAAEVTR